VVELVPCARKSAWSALHRHRLELAECSLAKLRQVAELKIDVAGDEEIEITISVIISPRGAG
jgi:hypothetical protein